MNKLHLLLFSLVLSGCSNFLLPPSTPEEQQAEYDKQHQENNKPIPHQASDKEKIEALEKSLTSWHGTDINILITQRGIPTSTYQLPNGNTMYSFKRSYQDLYCITNFTSDKKTGVVIGHSWIGLCY